LAHLRVIVGYAGLWSSSGCGGVPKSSGGHWAYGNGASPAITFAFIPSLAVLEVCGQFSRSINHLIRIVVLGRVGCD